MATQQHSVGALLRQWRERRRYSQLALAVEAEISQRHLSFIESGRSSPSREMVLRLARYLQIPLRETNAMLLAAGFAPAFGERTLAATELEAAREAIDHIVHANEPHPALAVDRLWTLISTNKAVAVLTQGASAHLLKSDVNVLRLSMHPEGLAPRIINYGQWRNHILARLAHDIEISGDVQLASLLDELKSYPIPAHAMGQRTAPVIDRAVAIPLVIRSDLGPLRFLSTTTVFGTAVDVTLAEIVVESFFPADPATAQTMRMLMAGS